MYRLEEKWIHHNSYGIKPINTNNMWKNTNIINPIFVKIWYILFWKILFPAFGDVICSIKNIKNAMVLINQGISKKINNGSQM